MSRVFEEIATEMMAADPRVTSAKMFGMSTLKISGKAFAGTYGDDMVFKLGGDAHDRALQIKAAHLFDPMGGRPMKQWVVVPVTSQSSWPDFANAAKSYVEGLRK